MHILNLGVLAHVDAGKTSLTERLLYAAGVIDEIGSVDDGTTQTDSLALERQRGITIKSAVVSFTVGNVTVNLIDTPGHPDFIAEVERALSVLDGAVLVISAVEGVQPQTRILMRALQRLRVPTLLFVNKIDRRGAGYRQVLRAISERLTPAIVPMGSARELGTRAASFTAWDRRDAAATARLAEALAGQSDSFLAAYLAGDTTISGRRLTAELAAQVSKCLVHPVYFGSALTGAGLDCLICGIATLLPAAGGDPDGPVSGSVFKVERGPAGEKIAYGRMFSGTVRVRDQLRSGTGKADKVTAISVFDHGSAARRTSVGAGHIAKLWGLTGVQVGDALGHPPPAAVRHRFAPPTLETVALPSRPQDKGALHAALAALAEQDPLINVRQDDARQEIFVSLYGEVQKEVVAATLAADFGLQVSFRETTTICIERPVGTGAAVERLGEAPNPFLATVGLRIGPAAAGSGVCFRREAELGSMPLAFFRAVEDTVRETLLQGIYGWEVTDCAVALTHTGYLGKHGLGHQRFNKSMSSTGEDYRYLAPLVLMSALQKARTEVCEPVSWFRLDFPADCLPALLAALARLRARPQPPQLRGMSGAAEGEIPAGEIHGLRQQLPELTRGEGVLEAEFARYQPVAGPPPTRPRTGRNPLRRKDYLLQVQRRIRGGA